MSLEALPEWGLVEAVSDSAVLGAVPLWPAQLELLGGIEGGPRLHVVCWGRRASKTTMSAAVSCWMALLQPQLRGYLRPRERGWAVCVATNLEQARIWVEAARSLIADSPLLSGLVESESAYEIRFVNGMGLRALPCTSRSIRGYPIFCLVLDEFAHHQDGEGGSVAERVWGAVGPSTAQFGSAARVLVVSTPAGEDGLFPELYRAAEAGVLPGARSWRAASWEVNPTLDRDFLEMERLTMGDLVFDAEYGAEFAAGEGLMFHREDLLRVTSGGVVGPEDGRGWVAALDPSSGYEDAFGLAVVGRDARRGFEGRLLVAEVVRWLPRRGQKGARHRSRQEKELWMTEVLDGVAATVHRFNAGVVSDAHVPGVVQDELWRRGVRQVGIRPWTAHRRLSAFQALRARVQTERVGLPDVEELRAELGRVTTRFRGGGPVVHIGRAGDSHGDLAVALALGVWELDSSGVSRQRARLSRPLVLEEPPAARRLRSVG